MLSKKFINGTQYYIGRCGTKYQYDLSNPSDRREYSLDLEAQMRDKQSSNPHVLQENGAGIYDD